MRGVLAIMDARPRRRTANGNDLDYHRIRTQGDRMSYYLSGGFYKPGMFARWESRSLHILGFVLFIVALLLFPSLLYAAYLGESIEPFIWPMAIGLVVSIFLITLFKNPKTMHPADGLLMMIILWFALFLFGTLPYILCGMPFIDALFESVGGFSTTGATIMTDIESWPASLLLWRVMTHWIGGSVIVVMFMIIIPMVVAGGRSLLKNETSGSASGNLYMKLKDAAKQFIAIYALLTLFFAVVLMLLGVTPIDSFSIAMSTIATGGFMNTNDSIDGFSNLVKVAVTIFMFMSATNFYLHFRMIRNHVVGVYRRNEELRFMFVWFAAMSILICAELIMSGTWNVTGQSDIDNIIDVVFTVVSFGSTTGFTTVNFNSWFSLAGIAGLMAMMFVGGSAGSTSGGIKVSRGIVALRSIINEVRQQVHPNAVYSVKYDNEGLDDGVVHGSLVVIMMYIITVLVGAAILSTVMNMNEAIFGTVSLITGTGPGIGDFYSGFATLPDWAKIFSCILMFMGRMEVAAALVIFSPAFWKEIMGPGWSTRMIKSIRDRRLLSAGRKDRALLLRRTAAEASSEHQAAEKKTDKTEGQSSEHKE